MATFADIQDRVLRQSENRDSLPESLLIELPEVINDQIRRACEWHPWYCLEQEVGFTTVAATRLLAAMPSDWRSRRGRPYLVLNSGGLSPMDWLTSEEDTTRTYSNMSTEIGAPQRLLEMSAGLNVYPYSNSASDYTDKQYRVRVPYYKYLPALVAGLDTNWFTLNAVNLLVYATVGELLARLGRQEALGWLLTEDPVRAPKTQTDREYRRLVRADKLSRLGTDPMLIPRKNVYASPLQRRGW